MADGMTVDSLQIEIEASSDDAVKKINSLVASLQQIKGATSGVTASLKSVVSGIKSLDGLKEIKNAEVVAKQLEALKRAANGFSNNAGDNLVLLAAGLKSFSGISISKNLAENMTKLSEALRNIHEKDAKRISAVAQSMTAIAQVPSMTKAINQLDKLPEVLDRLRSADISGVADKMRELSEAMAPLADRMKDIYSGFSSLPKNIQDFVKNYKVEQPGIQPTPTDPGTEDAPGEEALERKATLWERIKSLIEATRAEAGRLKETLNNLPKPIQTFLGALKWIAGSGLSGLKKIGKSISSSITAPFKNAVKAVTKWKDAIGRVAFYRVVRSAIKMIEDGFREGTENLYQYSRMVGTEFAPAMDKLATSALYLKNSFGAIAAPLIQAVAPAVDMLVDKFVELMNVIGKTFAMLTGKSVYTQAKKHAVEYKDAANDASKATKKFLLGIDELTILDNPAGGASSSMEDYSSMFEEVEVPADQFDWVKQIRDAIDNGEWKSVGTLLARKLNSVISGLNMNAWGKSLGAKINKGLDAAYGFMKTFGFKALGSQLSEGLNGILNSVNFDELGRLFTTKFTAVFDMLLGFFTTLDYSALGKAIRNFLVGAFSEMGEWITSIDWSETAHTLYNGLKEAILGLDLSAIAKSFFYMLGAALGAAVSFIGTFVGDIWNEITGYFDKYLKNDDGTNKLGLDWVAGLLQGIWDGIKGIGTWIYENVFKPFIDGFKSAFGIHSPSTVMAEMGGYIVDGLLQGILNGWGDIGLFFSEKLSDIEEAISTAWDNIKQGASEKWDTIKANLGDAWDNIKTSASEKFTETKENISTAWENVRASTEEKWSVIKTTLGTAWDNLKTSAGEKFTAIKDSISDKWENVKTATGEKWGNIKTDLSDTWDNLKTTAGTDFENIKSTVSEKWDNIKSDTSVKWDNVKSTLSDAWDSMKSTASTKLEDIKSSISSIWGDIVSAAEGWGQDLCDNLASGIRSGARYVEKSMEDVAGRMSKYVHFSEPDIGPLSNFHTYMPDMMNLMAKGIKDNSYLAVNAAYDLADTMSKTLGNIEPVEPKFSVHENLFASVQPAYGGANSDTVSVSPQSNDSPDSMEIINAMFAVGQQIVSAINENSDRPINIDWGSVASGMTSMQNRQNMMYGKTLQNY